MASVSTAKGGDGFLSLRLERALDMQLRRRIGMRDWAFAVLVVGLAQLTGIIVLSWLVFGLLLAVALLAIALWYWVFPRLTQQRALWLEVAMNFMTIVVVVGLVAASGGPESPYIFFYAFIVVFIAAFVEMAAARTALIAIACLSALAPIVYDWDQAVSGDFVPTIVIAVVVWAAAGALIALKRMSAVNAEIEARSLAYVDSVTGAATRRAIEEYVQLVQSCGLTIAVAYVRATGIGDVNRVGGHLAGDRILGRLGEAMHDASGPADQVARLGGVEFVAVLPGANSEDAAAWLMRFRERLALADARAADETHTAAIAGAATGDDLSSAIANARSVLESVSYGKTLPDCAPSTAAERAEHLREQLADADAKYGRSAIESVRAPSGVWLAAVAALLLGLAIAATGGATSILLSVAILLVSYFATFGSRIEAIVATGATMLAVLAAVISQAPVTSIDQMRTFTVLVTMLVIADTVQRNVRMLMLAERRAAELSLVDTQTGVGNRTAFERDLVRLLAGGGGAGAREQRLAGPPAVIAVDLVDRQELSERIGRASEDFALLSIAEALRDAVGGEGSIYRIGIDDFGVILRTHHQHHLEEVIARCREETGYLLGARPTFGGDDGYAIRFGGAVWETGMTAADLAAAAVSDQLIAASSPALAVR